MKDTAICVLTYNRKAILQETLAAIIAQKGFEETDLIIADNHSTDGTFEAIERFTHLDNVTYIDTGSNLGGAAGFQFLIRNAVCAGYKRLWIMDDDCIPQENALHELRMADEQLQGNFGWLSSLAYWTDGSLNKQNEHDYRLGKRITDFSKALTPAITASYVSLYLNTDAVLELGLPIKEFYHWSDDWEYTRRISRKFPCFVVRDSKVTHKTVHNYGMSIVTDSDDRIPRYRYAFRNEIYVLKQEGIYGAVHYAAKLAYYTVKVIFQSRRSKLKKLKIMYSAAWEGMHFHPQVEFVERK